MIKKILLLLCCLVLTGCKAQAPVSATTPVTTEPAAVETTAAQTEVPTTIPEQTVTVFCPNADATGFEQMDVTVSGIDEKTILSALISAGAIPSDVEVLSFRQEDTQLYLDLNNAFGTHLRSTGTAGETMLLGSLVNTYLTAYGAEAMTVTENGQILESGHAIYDTPLEFFS